MHKSKDGVRYMRFRMSTNLKKPKVTKTKNQQNILNESKLKNANLQGLKLEK